MKLRRPVIVIVLLVVALLASIASSAVFYSRGRSFYLQLSEVRLDPLGLDQYPTDAKQVPSLPSHLKRVVFFGDSRAEEWVAPANLAQVEFVNRGIANQTSAQVLERFDEHVAPLEPHIVVVQVGINDLKAIPVFPERTASIVANCKSSIEQIVARARRLGATVILTTVFPVGAVPLERRLFWSDDVAIAIEEVNGYLASLAQEQVLVLDSVAILADEHGVVRREYSRDLLHLDKLGYEALNEELVGVLEALIR